MAISGRDPSNLPPFPRLFIHETHFFLFVDEYDALLCPKHVNCRRILNKSTTATYRCFSTLQMLIFYPPEFGRTRLFVFSITIAKQKGLLLLDFIALSLFFIVIHGFDEILFESGLVFRWKRRCCRALRQLNTAKKHRNDTNGSLQHWF